MLAAVDSAVEAADVETVWNQRLRTLLERSPNGRVRVLFLGDSILRGMFVASVEQALRFIPALQNGSHSDAPTLLTPKILGSAPIGKMAKMDWPIDAVVRARSPLVLSYQVVNYFSTENLKSLEDHLRESAPPRGTTFVVVVNRGAWDAVWGDGDAVSTAGQFCSEVAAAFGRLRSLVPTAAIFALPLAQVLPASRDIGLTRRCPIHLRARVFREAFMCGVHKFNHAYAAAALLGRVTGLDVLPLTQRFPFTALPDGVHLDAPHAARVASHVFGWIVQHDNACLLPVDGVAPFVQPGGPSACDASLSAAVAPIPAVCFGLKTLERVWNSGHCVPGDLKRELLAFQALLRALLITGKGRCWSLLSAVARLDRTDLWLCDVEGIRSALDACRA